MSAMKRVYEDVVELTVEAVEAGANNVNDVVVYVNSQTPIRVDEQVIETIWSQLFAWHDEELEYHFHY